MDQDNYGRLKLLEIFIEERISKYNNLRREKRCKCLCNCGNIIVTNYSRLIKGVVKSCGCYAKDQCKVGGKILKDKTSQEDRQIKYLYSQYKSHAKYNNRDFEINIEDFKNIVFSNCHYCGSAPSNLTKSEKYGGPFYYNGIDRKDTSKHYTLDNSLSCCIRCNVAKNNMGYEEFREWIKTLYFRFGNIK